MKRLSTLAVACLSGVAWIAAAGLVDSRVAQAQSSKTPPDAIVPGVPVLPTVTDSNARTLHVGPRADYATPSAAAAAAHDGDTIDIASGDYHGDVALWTAHRLKIVGGTPRPHLFADDRDMEGKAIWVIRGNDISIDNVEMSGAHVPDRNGAALRIEGRNFTLRNAYLHDNENGLLTGANPDSEIIVDHCEFARNGNGIGQTHNIYVGVVARFVVSKSYLHHAIGGHNLKSRALVTIVTDSRLADEADGRASYEIDASNGGRVTLAFNILQKGPRAENATLVAYGAEGLSTTAVNELVVKGNTFISQRNDGTRFLFIAPGTKSANINGNVFAGVAALPDIPSIRANNAVQKEMPGNVDLKPDGFP